MRRLTIKHSAIAYILNREMGYTQNAIAKLMGVSQGTVSNMIKEFELQTIMENIQAEKRMPQTKTLSLSQSWRNSINLCIIAYQKKLR